jgi:hypothetical protein
MYYYVVHMMKIVRGEKISHTYLTIPIRNVAILPP